MDNKDIQFVSQWIWRPFHTFMLLQGYTYRRHTVQAFLFYFSQWSGRSICTMVKGSGLRLAAGAGSRALREPGSSVDLIRTDSAAGVTTRPREGEMQQKNVSNFMHQVSSLRFPILSLFGWWMLVVRSWVSNTRCTERSCSWLCKPSAQRRTIIRGSWTTTGWHVSVCVKA